MEGAPFLAYGPLSCMVAEINTRKVGTLFVINLSIYLSGKKPQGLFNSASSVTGGHILIQIGKSFGILYYWVYIKKFNDDWWITSVPAMRLQKWRISLNREFLLICV